MVLSDVPGGLSSEHTSSQPIQMILEILHHLQEDTSTPNSKHTVVEGVLKQKVETNIRRLENIRNDMMTMNQHDPADIDTPFDDSFIESFASRTFEDQLNVLRNLENDSMTAEDFATLAHSIRSFGMGMTECDRLLYKEALDS